MGMAATSRYTDEQVLDAIRRHHQQTGYMPSIRQLTRDLGFRSVSQVRVHVRRLEDAGRVVREAPGSPHWRLAE
jgi:SOS-response transcriptional repressor LexA